MKKIVLILFTMICGVLNGQDIKESAEEKIYSCFGNDIKIKMEKFTLPGKIKHEIEKAALQKFYSDFVYLFEVERNGSKTGYALLDNVLGKAMPITFIVLFNCEGEIISSHILKYREQYGGAVSNKNWNDQFIGRNAASSFEVGKDIDGISGATISVHSVSKGIKKLTMLIKFLRSK